MPGTAATLPALICPLSGVELAWPLANVPERVPVKFRTNISLQLNVIANKSGMGHYNCFLMSRVIGLRVLEKNAK